MNSTDIMMPENQNNTLQQEATADAGKKNSLRAWLYLIKCARRIDQEMSDRFRLNFNSSLPRFDVLAHLYQAGEEGLSTSQLAGRLLASKGNITRLLDRMEQDGLIRRQGQPGDRRISNISLSEKGAELFDRMAIEHENWSHEVFSQLTEAEIQEFVELLQRLNRTLDK